MSAADGVANQSGGESRKAQIIWPASCLLNDMEYEPTMAEAGGGHVLADGIDFGDVPPDVNALLQMGVAAYRTNRREADRIFRSALEAAPDALPIYFCLYKIHTYQGDTDEALHMAEAGLKEAARQADWDADWQNWQRDDRADDGPGRFGLYTLKALAFIHLRRGESDDACRILDKLSELDPNGNVGWTVVSALADGL